MTRRDAMLSGPALAMAVVATPKPPTVIRWKLFGRLGDHVGWRTVMSRADWLALPADSRPDAWLDDSGFHVTFETQVGKGGGS